MKKATISLTTIIVCIILITGCKSEAEKQYEVAEQAYATGNYNDALNTLESITDYGPATDLYNKIVTIMAEEAYDDGRYKDAINIIDSHNSSEDNILSLRRKITLEAEVVECLKYITDEWVSDYESFSLSNVDFYTTIDDPDKKGMIVESYIEDIREDIKSWGEESVIIVIEYKSDGTPLYVSFHESNDGKLYFNGISFHINPMDDIASALHVHANYVKIDVYNNRVIRIAKTYLKESTDTVDFRKINGFINEGKVVLSSIQTLDNLAEPILE